MVHASIAGELVPHVSEALPSPIRLTGDPVAITVHTRRIARLMPVERVQASRTHRTTTWELVARRKALEDWLTCLVGLIGVKSQRCTAAYPNRRDAVLHDLAEGCRPAKPMSPSTPRGPHET